MNLGAKEGTSSMRNDKEGPKKSQEIKAINKSLTFYKFIVDSVPSGVITVDRDLRITGFNPWAERLTGYSAAEAVRDLFAVRFFREACAIPSAR